MNTTPSYPSFSPYITVRNAAEAIAFYQTAFGARERFRLTDESTGKIGHAELTLAGSLLMLSDENPAWNKSPQTLGGTPVKFSLMVENADAAMPPQLPQEPRRSCLQAISSTVSAAARCAIPSATSGCSSTKSKKSLPKKCSGAGTK